MIICNKIQMDSASVYFKHSVYIRHYHMFKSISSPESLNFLIKRDRVKLSICRRRSELLKIK